MTRQLVPPRENDSRKESRSYNDFPSLLLVLQVGPAQHGPVRQEACIPGGENHGPSPEAGHYNYVSL